ILTSSSRSPVCNSLSKGPQSSRTSPSSRIPFLDFVVEPQASTLCTFCCRLLISFAPGSSSPPSGVVHRRFFFFVACSPTFIANRRRSSHFTSSRLMQCCSSQGNASLFERLYI